jgi:hypothetical protein
MIVKNVDTFIYETNQIRSGKIDIDLDMALWKFSDNGDFKGFDWEIYLANQTINFASTVYNPETDEESLSWDTFVFDPLTWKVKVKSENNIISLGGFYLSSVEIYPKESKLILLF